MFYKLLSKNEFCSDNSKQRCPKSDPDPES